MKQLTPKLIFSLFTIFALHFLTTPSANAHRPATGEEGVVNQLENITTSFAFYQELDSRAEVDIYSFTAQQGDFFHAGINIPAIAGLESYGVTMALTGPGLPALPTNALPNIDGHHAPGEYVDLSGGLIAPSQITEDFFEPFTQTNYWGRQSIDLDLPATGTYFLLIWNEKGATGKYVLDTGYEEVFSAMDMFRFPLWWLSVHNYFNHTIYIISFVALGLTLLFFLWQRRQQTPQPQPVPVDNDNGRSRRTKPTTT
ncbi:MAG TPA: hypothetical protein VLL52_06985 [Anaerolineae bacterium]|nr:hypothetical protein [Anaerolineae bacterium]